MWVWKVLPLAGGPAAIWGLTTRRSEKTAEPVTGQRPGSVPSLASGWAVPGVRGTLPGHLAATTSMDA